MRNLRKFNTESEYNSATLNYPAVSWVVSDDIVHFDKEAPVPPTPSFSGLTVYYNITDISQPTELFNYGSGSGSGSGGVLPSAMVIDGTEVYPTPIYQFDTVGEHIVNYSFVDNQIPESFLNGDASEKFSTVTKVEIGDTLTSISYGAFSLCTSLSSVTIPDSVTSIGGSAFQECRSLTSVTIGDSVTSIGSGAFQGCSSLTSVTIGSGVTSIGSGAFQGCSSLASVTVDTNNANYSSEDGVLFNKAKTTLIQYPIGNVRTSYTIPSSVTSISYRAFQSCTSLTSIDIPNSVTSIDGAAFNDCRSLTSVTIGSGVTSIGSGAFQGCSSLTSIVSNATTAPTIQNYTFHHVKTGGTLTVPSGSSRYNVWMQNANYYLGLYGWTKVEQ